MCSPFGVRRSILFDDSNTFGALLEQKKAKRLIRDGTCSTEELRVATLTLKRGKPKPSFQLLIKEEICLAKSLPPDQ